MSREYMLLGEARNIGTVAVSLLFYLILDMSNTVHKTHLIFRKRMLHIVAIPMIEHVYRVLPQLSQIVRAHGPYRLQQ